MNSSMPVRHQGNEDLFLAVEMSLVSTLAGIPLHVHAEGLRGTGKTTVMRWAREMMPSLKRIAGCPYQCDPENPRCPIHRTAQPGSFSTEMAPMPFVEIGHGAKLGTVLGSIDLSKLTGVAKPEAVILPGSIPMANRGIIFIDEVNRLAETAPEITDVLLSVMGTKPGLVKIEEVGIPPAEIEVTSSVWAASNPDEDPGPLEDIRKQLADRFDLVVPVQRPSDPAIIERILEGPTRPQGPSEDNSSKSTAQGIPSGPFSGLREKAERLAGVRVPQFILKYMAQLYVHRNVESLRAIEALELSSRLYAAISGRNEVTFDDLLVVIPLVLRHRVEPQMLSEILKDLEVRRAAGLKAKPQVSEEAKEKGDGRDGGGHAGSSSTRQAASPWGTDGLSRSGARPQGGQQEDPLKSALRSSERSGSVGLQEMRDAAHCEGGGDDYRRVNSARPAVSEPRRNWFQRLFGRRPRGKANEPGSGDFNAANRSQASSGKGQRIGDRVPSTLQDPSRLSPVSPPDPARKITSIPWEALIMPPDWREDPR